MASSYVLDSRSKGYNLRRNEVKDNSKFCINIKMYKTICVKRIKRDKLEL